MFNKKNFSTLLIIGLVVGTLLLGTTSTQALFGFGEDDKTKEKSEEPITVWSWNIAYKGLKEIEKEFEKKTGIQVEIVKKNNAKLQENLLLSINSGEGGPDIATMESFWAPRYIATNGFVEISDKVKPHADDFVQYKWDSLKMNGDYYGVPWDIGPCGVFYRRDVFEEAGLPTKPEKVAKLLATWEDYYEVAKKVKQKTGKKMLALPKGNFQGNPRLFQIMLQQQKVSFFNSNGEVIVDKPKAIKTAKYFNKFWEEDLALNATAWSSGWYAGIKKGEIATLVNGSWMAGMLKSFIAPKTSKKWGVVPLPAWEEGGVRTANSGGSVLAITKQADNKEKAWKFIKFALMNRETQLKMYKTHDLFPSLKTTYDADIFDKSAPYFKGQKYRKLFAELAPQIPSINYTTDFQEARKIVSSALERVGLGKVKSVEQALEKAAESIRSQTGRK